MVAKARTCERDTGERVVREIKRDRASEREQDRRSGKEEVEGKREKDRMERAEASRLGKKAEAPSAARY